MIANAYAMRNYWVFYKVHNLVQLTRYEHSVLLNEIGQLQL